MKFAKIFRRVTPYIICALSVFFIYGGKNIEKLGIYSDDWERIDLYGFSEETSLSSKVSDLVITFPGVIYRVTHLFTIPLSSVLGDMLENQKLGMHMISLIINSITLVILYFLILELVNIKSIAFLFSLFIFTVPGRSSTFFWGSTQVEMVSILLFFLTLSIHFNYKIKPSLSVPLIFMSTILSVWSYEITAFIPLVFVSSLTGIRKSRAFIHLIGTTVAVSAVTFFKLYLYPAFSPIEPAKSIDKNIVSLQTLVTKIAEQLKGLFSNLQPASFFSYWRNYLDKDMAFLILAIVFLGCAIYLARDYKPNNKNINLIVIGLTIFIGAAISLVPGSSGETYFSIYGKHSRFTSLPSMGIATIVCGLYATFLTKKNEYLIQGIFVTLIALNFSGISRERNAYIKSWDIQTETLQSIDFSEVQGSKDAFIFVTGVDGELNTTDLNIPVFSDFWTVSYAFSITANNPNIEADISKNPYNRLDTSGGYQSKNWSNKYYPKESVYIINLQDSNPKVVPISKNI